MTKSVKVKNQIKGKIIAWQCPTPVSEVTRPKTNVEPQTRGLEDDFPFQMGDAQVPCYFSGVLQTTQEEIQSIPPHLFRLAGLAIGHRWKWPVEDWNLTNCFWVNFTSRTSCDLKLNKNHEIETFISWSYFVQPWLEYLSKWPVFSVPSQIKGKPQGRVHVSLLESPLPQYILDGSFYPPWN